MVRGRKRKTRRPYVTLEAAADLLGIKLKTAQNAIANGKFRLPTYKLGKRRVVDRMVISRFFALKRAEGLSVIEKYVRHR
jgi:predicted site-specific integrase-resolvase